MKVSFDFDGTLSRFDVIPFASELIRKGVDVWVCTSRFEDRDNSDLFALCGILGINISNVIFCNMQDKYTFLDGKDFIWHLDDDWIELDMINRHTNTKGISVFGNSKWKRKCEKLLKI